MGKEGLFIVSLFLALMVLGLFSVSALQHEPNRRMALERMQNRTNSTNMTYGLCVSEFAKLKNDCYAENRNVYLNCSVDARNSTENVTGRNNECRLVYRAGKNECKSEFKSDKMECKRFRKNFADKMRFWR